MIFLKNVWDFRMKCSDINNECKLKLDNKLIGIYKEKDEE